MILSNEPATQRLADDGHGDPQIVVSGLTHTYRPARGRQVTALDDVSMTVAKNEFVALLGPSGCGKSTLLYLLGGFLPIERGSISVLGKPVREPGPDRGIVFQHFALFPWKTVRANVQYGLDRKGMPRGESAEKVREILEQVGLKGFEDSYPSQLSGGMRQRAAIARTLVLDPSTLLMDEPFGALDAQTRNMMQIELLALWRRSPKAVVFVTHDVHEAVYLADRIFVMSARPGRMRSVVQTRIDRSDPGFVKSREFVDQVEEIWTLVREEASKAGAK